MTSPQNPIHSPAAPATPHTAVARAPDLYALAGVLGPSVSRRFDACAVRDAPSELGYGCVDWFIYGTDARVASAPITS